MSAEGPVDKASKSVQRRIRTANIGEDLLDFWQALVGTRLCPQLLLQVRQKLYEALKLVYRGLFMRKAKDFGEGFICWKWKKLILRGIRLDFNRGILCQNFRDRYDLGPYLMQHQVYGGLRSVDRDLKDDKLSRLARLPCL